MSSLRQAAPERHTRSYVGAWCAPAPLASSSGASPLFATGAAAGGMPSSACIAPGQRVEFQDRRGDGRRVTEIKRVE